jgi:hypothetical protein
MRWVILCVLAAGCGDNAKQPTPGDAGADATPTPDSNPQRLTGCLDTPGLAMAPNGQLPCDLVPPGQTL